jgi:hypothetical protein
MALTSIREECVDPLDEGNVGRLSSLISPWARRSRSDGELPEEIADRSSGRRPTRPNRQVGLQEHEPNRRRSVSPCLISAAKVISARSFLGDLHIKTS